jgi:GNAT superfamily N-acetyltransferase
MDKEDQLYLTPRHPGVYIDSDKLLFRYVKRLDGIPVGFIDLYPYKLRYIVPCAYITIGVRKEYQHQGISTELLDKAVEWAKDHNYDLGYAVDTKNKKSLGAALKYGFEITGQNKSSTYLKLKLRKENKLCEDLGNTPKGYKDINNIIQNCNLWFEANPDKSDKICWSQHVQIRNWSLELKKYRSKFGPITYERDLKELKLKPSSDNDIKMNLDKAILHAFGNWRKNQFNMEDRNRELMYCLIELREYRKKFKKQKDFSCKI